MKKRIIIIASILLAILIVFGLHYTYATNSTASDTYTIELNGDNSTITIPRKTSKTVYYHISNNNNNGTVQYGVGYTSNNIKAKVWYDTIDAETGFMNYGEHKFIKLKLINDSSTDDTITLSTVLGYERGGDLIVPEGTTMVTEKIKETNYIMESNGDTANTNYLRGNLKKEEISSITFTNDNIVPDNMTSVDVSKDGDGTVIMWYGSTNSDGLYDVYIGSENGITSIYNGAYMFSYLTKMKSIDLRYTDTSNVTNMSYMFYECNLLESLDLSSFNTSKVTTMRYMFCNCSSLTELNISNFDTSNVTNMSHMFQECSLLTKLDLSNFDTSKVTAMNLMFYNCSSLIKVDINSFDTSKVTIMESMFSGCSSLTHIDLSNFNTSNVTDMASMFSLCSSLLELDLSNFDTSKVTTMLSIFNSCSSLAKLDLSSFNTSKVTTMRLMFYNCSSLAELNISNFNTENVTNMSHMFQGCSLLTKLDLRNADFSNITNYDYMFYSNLSNMAIYVKDSTQKEWIESKFTNLTNVIVA